MERETHIISYFSLETDVAGEMRDWPEFVCGQEYSVDLKDADSGEAVAVRLVKVKEQFVSVKGSGPGSLYDKVLGRVIYALAAHSDNLLINRRT